MDKLYDNSTPCATLGDVSKTLRELLYLMLLVDDDAKNIEVTLHGKNGDITAIWTDNNNVIVATRVFHDTYASFPRYLDNIIKNMQ